MGTRLFIGGLSWGTDDAALRTAFGAYGTVTDARVVMDRETGRSRGFGFVAFATDEQAQAAIAAMEGAELDGRNIRVNEAQERGGPSGPPRGPRPSDGPRSVERRPPSGGRSGPSGGGYGGPSSGGYGGPSGGGGGYRPSPPPQVSFPPPPDDEFEGKPGASRRRGKKSAKKRHEADPFSGGGGGRGGKRGRGGGGGGDWGGWDD